MSDTYYTNVSIKQAGILSSYAKQGALNITENMARYIFSIAMQGAGHACDRNEEDFRRQIRKAVTVLMRSPREKTGQYMLPEKKALEEASEIIWTSFEKLCMFRDSKYLNKVRMEIEEKNNVSESKEKE